MRMQELVYQMEHKISMLETKLVGQGRQIAQLESRLIILMERVDSLTNPL